MWATRPSSAHWRAPRREAEADAPPAAIGSIKANVGHTKAAAGVAGLIKAALALEAQIVPPTTGCRIGAIYDESKSLADNFGVYYHARPFRRFHDFLTYAMDDWEQPCFPWRVQIAAATHEAEQRSRCGPDCVLRHDVQGVQVALEKR